MNDHSKGLLITLIGVLFVVPDSIMVRLISSEPMVTAFWRSLTAGTFVAISELMEVHVCQKPTPKGATIPLDIAARLNELIISETQKSQIARRARAMRITS